MDPGRFDRLTLQVGDVLSRRHFGAMLSLIGLGAGIGAASDALGKKKKKKKKCKGGTTKCGKGCVNVQADPQHCGGCNTPCGAGQTCQGGQCTTGGGGCTGGLTSCDGQCVNAQTSAAHCGSCDNPCGQGTTCEAGECGSDLFCNSQADCGGEFNNHLECNLTKNRCECIQLRTIGPDYVTCGERHLDGGGLCGRCCPGGLELGQRCLKDGFGEYECVNQTIQGCQCPAAKPQACPAGTDFGFCSENLQTDPKACGQECVNCSGFDSGFRCCAGSCVRGCNPGANAGDCLFEPCGNSCTACTGNQRCCNAGPGTPSQCVDLVSGRCPS